MTTQVRPDCHEQALELAEAGQYQEALNQLDTYLETSPNQSEALNDAGVLLHCLDRSDEAIGYLQRAHALDEGDPEIIWNLVEAYLAEARADEAKLLLKYMAKSETIRIDILNRAAHIFLSEDKLDDAIEMLEWSLRLAPNQEILEPMLTVIRHKKNEQDNTSA